MFQNMNGVAGFHPLNQGSRIILGGVDQTHTRLIQCYLVCGSQNPPVMHVRFRRISIAVTVDRQMVHYADIIITNGGEVLIRSVLRVSFPCGILIIYDLHLRTFQRRIKKVCSESTRFYNHYLYSKQRDLFPKSIENQLYCCFR